MKTGGSGAAACHSSEASTRASFPLGRDQDRHRQRRSLFARLGCPCGDVLHLSLSMQSSCDGDTFVYRCLA